MRRILFVFIIVWLCLLLQGGLHVLFGRVFSPNLMIILVVLFNLFRGIRYSLLAAVMAGLLCDSLSSEVFGINLFSFILCAYLTTVIKKVIYQPGSAELRILLVFVVCVINIFVHYLVSLMTLNIGIKETFARVFLPETLGTTMFTPYIYGKFKLCVLKFFG